MRIAPLVIALGCAMGAARAAAPPAPDGMADLTLEQLSDIVVSSVSRQDTSLASAPASVYIISAADIRRSGARSLPDALRLAPNLQVAREDARIHAISARGFNSAFSNKLLVLIDGRSVYSPLFSGVFWDAQDVVMEDVERIEVISGPGATIWGVNAVNGVINVITRHAAATQGGLVSASYGEHEHGATVRYGTRLANGMHVRSYARRAEVDDSVELNGRRVSNAVRRHQAGFRADLDLAGGGALTLSGDAYQGRLMQLGMRDTRTAGANLVARYTGTTAGGGDLRLQLVADHTQRDQRNAFREHLNTIEVEAQHGVRARGHNLIWGGGYRQSWDRLDNGPEYGFLPASFDMRWANLFVQDEFALTERLRTTAGIKAEYNHYTGTELLPSLRLAWTPAAEHLFWGSLARTVRAPSRIDRDLYSPTSPSPVDGMPGYVVGGGPRFDSEVARVAELGYRGQPLTRLAWAATLWTADYDRLRTFEPQANGTSVFANLGEGRTRGVEMWARWTVTPGWRLDGSAVLQRVRTWTRPDSRDASAGTGIATNDPRRRYTLRSAHDLSPASQLEWSLRYVGALPQPAIPSYHELDLHWIWAPLPNLDITVSGRNLLHRSHLEFGAPPNRSALERAVVVGAAYRF